MSIFLRVALLICFGVFIVGCVGVPQRRAILDTLGPAPMSEPAWAAIAGTYTGPVRSTVRRFGDTGTRVAESRIELSGDAEHPRIFLKMQTGYTSEWAPYGERTEAFTNIPERSYGTQGGFLASTHAPDQLLLRFRSGPLSSNAHVFWIIEFHGRDCAEVTAISPWGRHGEGTLHRVPVFSGVCK